MRDHEMSDELINEKLHYASRCLRDQWIEKDSAREVFKRDKEVQNTRNDQMIMNQSYSNQNETKDLKNVQCDDTRLSSLYWVFYVHFEI
jgi:SLT domain-containing protein